MTTYYVRKTGNDSTGDGSTALPWLTINKAITTASSAGGHVIIVGDGTYEETSGSGYLYITKAFTAAVTIRSESASAAAVVIKGTSGTSYNVLYQPASGAGIVFEDLTFEMRVKEISNGAFRIARSAALVFNRCIFTGLTDTATQRQALLISPGSGVTVTGVVFNNCTFQMTGADNAYAVRISPGSGTTDGVTFNSCTASAVQYGLYVLQGCANINVSGGTYSNTGAGAGLIYGTDGETPTANVSGTISGATISSTASHACLIGCRSGGVVTVTGCTITGGDYGVVVKENAGTVVTNNYIINGTSASLYFKAGTGATATRNYIHNSVGGVCIQAGAGSTGNTFGSLTITDNRALSIGAGSVYNWNGASDAGTSCVVDRNRYRPLGSGRFGAVRGDAAVLSMRELRAAWADYGAGTNDSHSRMVSDAAAGMLALGGKHG